MKKVISIIVGLLFAYSLYAYDVNFYSVFVDTNGVVAINMENKLTFRLTNGGTSYVYLATAPVTMDNYFSTGAYAVAGKAEYIDNFYVYKSTWYVTTGVLGESTTVYIEVRE